MLCNSGLHCWGNAQALMNSAEIVMDRMNRKRVHLILYLFRVCIRKPSESAHLHSDRQVVTLDVTGRNVLRIWLACDLYHPASNALRRALPGTILTVVAVHFDEHCISISVPNALSTASRYAL
jgi:hypothetical protein